MLCSVVQCGAEWCRVVQSGAVWCSVVQGGAGWCKVVRGVTMFFYNALQSVAAGCNGLDVDGVFHMQK